MARVLADGTGAELGAGVGRGRRPADPGRDLAADARGRTDGRPPDDVPGAAGLPVRHGGELLGVLVVQERDRVPLTPVEERLFAGLADQAGLVLRGARLRAELELRLAELSAPRRGAAGLPRAAGRRPGRRAPCASSATSTTAPSSTWSRSR